MKIDRHLAGALLALLLATGPVTADPLTLGLYGSGTILTTEGLEGSGEFDNFADPDYAGRIELDAPLLTATFDADSTQGDLGTTWFTYGPSMLTLLVDDRQGHLLAAPLPLDGFTLRISERQTYVSTASAWVAIGPADLGPDLAALLGVARISGGLFDLNLDLNDPMTDGYPRSVYHSWSTLELYPDETRATTPPIPEPGLVLLLGLGLVAVARRVGRA